MKKLFSSLKIFLSNTLYSLSLAFKASPGSTSAVLIIVIITALIPFGTAKVTANIIDALVGSVKTGAVNNNVIILYALLWAFLDGFNSIVNAARFYINTKHQYKVRTYIEYLILNKYSEIDIGRYEQSEFQNLRERALGSRGYAPLNDLGKVAMLNATWDIVEIIVASLVIGLFDWRIYLLIIATSIPKFIADLKLGERNWGVWTRNKGEEQRRYTSLKNHITTTIPRIELHLYQSFKLFLSRIKVLYDRTTADLIVTEKKRLWLTIIFELISTVGFGIAIYLVVGRVLGAALAIGQMTFIVSSIGRLSGGIGDLLYNVTQMYDENRFVTDIRTFLNIKPLVQTPEPKELKLFAPPVIVFENVSFNYPEQPEKVIKNINLTIESGQKIGLVGNNGAGKSTFIKLLCRIYDPTEGKITVNGIDLKHIAPNVWQSYLSVLMQDYASYEFTVKEAISASQPEAPYDHTRMLWSAKVSQAYKFIEEWTNKYDEQLGVEFKGKEPSKGQRQKLALARTFYRKAPIMLLDEPTAAVDAESAIEIFKELDSMPKSITGIFISHDFSTIRRADRIVVMVSGEITENGTHEELVAKKGTYERLYNEQVKSLTEEKNQV